MVAEIAHLGIEVEPLSDEALLFGVGRKVAELNGLLESLAKRGIFPDEAFVNEVWPDYTNNPDDKHPHLVLKKFHRRTPI